jgi:hypothetical protein
MRQSLGILARLFPHWTTGLIALSIAGVAEAQAPPQTFTGPPMGGLPMTGDASGAWVAPAPQKKRVDPLVITAEVELAMGGAFVLAGVIPMGYAARSRHICGAIAGCFDAEYPEEDPFKGGAATLGFGLGFAGAGALSLAITSAAPLGPGETRSGGAVATVGHLTMATAMGLVVSGFAYGPTQGLAGTHWDTSWPLFLTGGLLTIAGIPMLAVGAPTADADVRGRRRARDLRSSLEPIDVRIGPGSLKWSWF